MSYLYRDEWILVDKILTSATSGRISFKSGGNGIMGYPVSGNLDGGYKLSWDLVGNATTGAAATLELNGGTTNQTYTRMVGVGAGGTNAAVGSAFGLPVNGGSASAHASGEFIMEASAATQTRMGMLVRGMFSSSPQIEEDLTKYNDSSTNITAIDFNITLGDVTGPIWLFVKNPQRPPLWSV